MLALRRMFLFSSISGDCGPHHRCGPWGQTWCMVLGLVSPCCFLILLGIKMERVRLALGLSLHDQEVPEPPKVLASEED